MNNRLDFPELCDALRRNDPSVTVIGNMPELPVGHGRELGLALQGNEHVSRLYLSLGPLLQPNEIGTQSAIPLLDYIQSGPALQKLVLTSSPRPQVELSVVSAFLNAAGESQYLKELNLNVFPVPSDALIQVLRTTRSIRHLTLNPEEIHATNNASIDDVANAVGVNQTVRQLVMYVYPNPVAAEPFLQAIGRSESSLTDLELRYRRDRPDSRHLDELVSLLERTSKLQHLELVEVVFDEVSLQHFLRGIRGTQSLEKLSLRNPTIDQPAKSTLVDFFREAEPLDAASSVQQFSISIDFFHRIETNTDIGQEVASMLTVRRDDEMSLVMTRGSNLQVVHLNLAEDVPFIDDLGSNASDVMLPCLRVAELKSIPAWSECIPKLVHMRELHFAEHEADPEYMEGPRPHFVPANDHDDFKSLVAAVRKNGSLHVLGLPPVDETWTFRDDELLRKLDAYTTRNRMVPVLLAAPASSSDIHDVQPAEMSHFPALFQSALPSPRFAFTNYLIGLQS